MRILRAATHLVEVEVKHSQGGGSAGSRAAQNELFAAIDEYKRYHTPTGIRQAKHGS